MSVTYRQRRMLEHVGENYQTIRQLSEVLGVSYGSAYATATELTRTEYLRGVPRNGVTHYTITPNGSKLLRDPEDAAV